LTFRTKVLALESGAQARPRGYLFVIGVGMTIMAPTGRLNRLSGDRCDDADTDAMVDHAVPFAAAGLRSFVTRAAKNGLR
jgi:hypothetical protein